MGKGVQYSAENWLSGNIFLGSTRTVLQYLQITISPLQIHPVFSLPNDDMRLIWRYLITYVSVASHVIKCLVVKCLKYLQDDSGNHTVTSLNMTENL
jgi:hypothetical protein